MFLRPRPHTLPAPLIVSLTSYPPRFVTLALTLKSLLLQTIKPDVVVLWIAERDKDTLTKDILALKCYGLTIAFCEDLRSYKKIVPSLQAYPGSFIVTADDDIYYWPDWLEKLVVEYVEDRREVVSHRVHRIAVGADGQPLPYVHWSFEIDQGLPASPLNFSTGIAGILYPPKAFHEDVSKSELFMKLAPRADDVWLHWMLRLNGWSARKVGKRRQCTAWDGSQDVALFHGNLGRSENDESIFNLVRKYGFPAT